MKRQNCTAAALATLLFLYGCGKQSQGERYDVVIVGATASGVGAAIAAGREGLKVALTEESPSLGGMFSNGVSHTNIRALGACSGIYEEFRQRVMKYHREHFPNDPIVNSAPKSQPHFFPFGRPWGSQGLVYEPRVADKIFKEMVAEIPGIRVFYRQYPVRVLKTGNRVTGVVTRAVQGGADTTFDAAIVMDATHEGDLLPLAEAAFRIGREPRTPEEPHAGAMYMTWDGQYFGSGEGDKKLQAFSMIITVKDYGHGADKTIPKPPGYDPANYVPSPAKTVPNLPNGKTNLGATDITDLNATYIDGDRAERQRIYEAHKNHALGLLYYRQTVMGEKNIGLADDEYPDNGNVPYMLYVREGRRLEGMYVYAERDSIRVPGFRRPPLFNDSIATGDWDSDSHQMAKDFEGYVHWARDETRDPYKIWAPHQIPYGVMVPKEVDGLLVPMAVSATHIGFGVLRTDPPRMSMGQAAGVAAALAIRNKIQPRQVSVPELQRKLLEQGSTLFYYSDLLPSHPHFQAIQRLSMAAITDGFDDYTYRPDEHSTKAHMSQVVFHGLDLKVKVDDWETDFWKMRHWNPSGASTRPSHWSSYYLMTLYKMGAITEEQALKMKCEDLATRADLAQWIYTGLGLKPDKAGEAAFADVTPSHPNYNAINALAHRKLMGPVSDNRFEPDARISRGEVCGVVDNVRKLLSLPEPKLKLGPVLQVTR
ncbi:MAG: FAD-dependent oxidoreductase [Bryobacteraceae bacterium]